MVDIMKNLINFFFSFDKLMKEKLILPFFWLAVIVSGLWFFQTALDAIALGVLANVVNFFEFFVRIVLALVSIRLVSELAVAKKHKRRLNPRVSRLAAVTSQVITALAAMKPFKRITGRKRARAALGKLRHRAKLRLKTQSLNLLVLKLSLVSQVRVKQKLARQHALSRQLNLLGQSRRLKGLQTLRLKSEGRKLA